MGNLESDISRNMTTYSDLTQTIIGIESSRSLNGYWGYGHLPVDFKNFIFKLHNNILSLNSRVAHFNNNVAPICTFCNITNREDAENESTLHLFFECPSTEVILNEFFRWAYNKDDTFHISCTELFIIQKGRILGDDAKSKFQTLIAKIFLKYIWDCKIRFNIPNLVDSKTFAMDQVRSMYMASSNLRSEIDNSGLANIFLQG